MRRRDPLKLLAWAVLVLTALSFHFLMKMDNLPL